jgi:hypothetical protein
MIENIKNDINKYFSLENQIKSITDKLAIIRDFNQIIQINYNINVSWKNNYDFYLQKQNIPTIKIKSHFFQTIHQINQLCKNKSELELLIRQKKVQINTIKNYIINNILEKSIDLTTFDINIDINKLPKYKSIMWRPTPILSLNKPELQIKNILFDLQLTKKEIICIYPHYRLPVKFKSCLIADFYLLLYINYTIYPLIIEFDGQKHHDHTFIYFNSNSTKADIIKNNFALLNSISIIRITSIDDITFHMDKCIDHITKTRLFYTHLPTYQSYIQLLH